MPATPTPFPQGIFVPFGLLKSLTVAHLPATPITGYFAVVSDSSTAVVGATVTGGGSNKVLTWYNGTNWVVMGGAPGVWGSSKSQGALTTAGAGTITGALILDGNIKRTGPTGAFNDTTDTAALIQAAWTGGGVNSSFLLTYENTTAFPATILAGSGVTLADNVIIPANTWAEFLVVWTGTNTVTMYNIAAGQLSPLPPHQYATSSVTTGVIAAGLLTGAESCTWLQTGATPGNQTTRTAAQLLADTPNGRVGMVTRVRIANSGAGVFTLVADGSVTLSGAATIAQNTWKDYLLTILTASTASMQYIGAGTY